MANLTASGISARRRTWSLLWRYGLAVLLGVSLLAAASPLAEVIGPVAGTAVDVILGIASGLTMRLRHRRPLTLALALMVASLFAITTSGFMLWSFLHLCTRRRWREIVPAFIVSIAIQVVAMVWSFPQASSSGFAVGTPEGQASPDEPAFLVAWIVTSVGFTALLTAWGLYIGARRDLVASLRERAETAEREQELQVLAGQAAERNRIAREMHDVLAHRMSLVSMHSGALAYREDLTPEQTREIARTIQENAHQSLTELRSVLGSLRDDNGTDAGPAPAKPQPVLVDVHTLIADAREAGDKIDLEYRVHGDLPDRVGRHAYRIVQEALTNARKHAPHTRVSLSITGDPDAGLSIVARNPQGRTGHVPGAGAGLLGLTERAQMLGGTIDHGLDDEGSFELRVWLPW